MKQLLQSKYNVLTASNGGEALQIVHEKPVDLIVSDVMMPGINGYELTSALKQDEKFDHLPIILLTAKVQEEDRMDALTAGADDIIAKPFKMRELQLRIDNIIANRQRVLSDSTSNELDITDMAEQKPLTGDQEYLQRAIRCINENISDADYDRNAFAADMSSSVSTLYNKIRALTGKNVTTFVRDIRIKTACRLAKENPDLRVSDIAYRVGFRDPKYFATSFKRVMGTQPKEYFDHLRGVRDEISKVPQT
jgi:DNA-binding response OmpR family regulator